MAQIIYHHKLEELATELAQRGRVVAPIEKHPHSGASKIVFGKWEKGERLSIAYPTTVLPPKEFLLPPTEEIFSFIGEEIIKFKPEETIIFGVNYEDMEGISRLKKIFNSPIEDQPFNERAKNLTIVAIDRFSPPAKIDFDLYLQKISTEKYAAFAGSAAGKKILNSSLFKNEKVRVPHVTKQIDPLLSDPLLSEAVAKSKDSKVWDELAERCFGCGICSFACPLCYCFKTEDRIELSGKSTKSGARCRSWDTCFAEDFAATSGHNFRPELRDRIYNWYFHKFVRMNAEHGFDGCVDCNRCIIFCPAKINYRVVLQELLKDYKNKVAK